MWHVDRNELHASLLQAQQEVRIAAQSVELGDHELRVVGATGFERFVESRPIIGAFAALHLDMLFDKLPPAPVQPCLDRRALGFQAKAAFALALGGDPKIGDEFSVMWGHATKAITKVTVFVKVSSSRFRVLQVLDHAIVTTAL